MKSESKVAVTMAMIGMAFSTMAVIGWLAIVTIAMAGTAFGRIGETPKECQQRYGNGIQSKTGYTIYRKSGYLVCATFHEGQCDSIGFRREKTDVLDRPEELTNTEIDAILGVNGKSWDRISSNPFVRLWRGEGGLVATYDTTERILSIVTADYLKRQKAEQLAKEKGALKDF